MSASTPSIALPRRLSVNIKLGKIFLVLAALATGNLVFSNVMYGSIADIADLINQSGQLRFYSQKIALNSTRFVLESSDAAREVGLEAEVEFEMRYASVAREVEHLHPLMHSAGDNLDMHLKQIDQTWHHQRAALARVLAESDVAARLAAQREVAADAVVLLGQTDGLVSALEKAERSAHQRVDHILYLALALEILLMLGAFFYVRSRITLPIHNLISFLQRFAIGKQAAHRD